MEWKPFSTDKDEIAEFFTPAGSSLIESDRIEITNYPFEPATVYPSATVMPGDIDDISIDSFPPMLRLKNELIFISAQLKEKLKAFAETNNIPIVKRTWNWDSILEPFLDTDYDDAHKRRTLDNLNRAGISNEQVAAIREEVREQMFRYNFDTMLWEWQAFGMDDVLRAMRPKYNKEQFKDFYWRAMEIELKQAPDA